MLALVVRGGTEVETQTSQQDPEMTGYRGQGLGTSGWEWFEGALKCLLLAGWWWWWYRSCPESLALA